MNLVQFEIDKVTHKKNMHTTPLPSPHPPPLPHLIFLAIYI
jgi:hypothetical protein